MNRPLRVLLTGGNGQLGRDLRDVLAGAAPDGGQAVGSAGILPTVADPPAIWWTSVSPPSLLRP